jgi:hypothetical protein
MDNDLLITIGIILVILVIPSLLAAWVEGRPPRIGAVVLIGAGIMIAVAVTGDPDGYAPNEIPSVMMEVFGRYIN